MGMTSLDAVFRSNHWWLVACLVGPPPHTDAGREQTKLAWSAEAKEGVELRSSEHISSGLTRLLCFSILAEHQQWWQL